MNYDEKTKKFRLFYPDHPGPNAGRDKILGHWLDASIIMAQIGWNQGGVPIGSALIDSKGIVVAIGHNNRHQWNDPTAHGEIDCMRNAGNRKDWKCCSLMSTLSCCQMCSGMIALYNIPYVVAAEDKSYQGPTSWLIDQGINIRVMQSGPQHKMCIFMMHKLKTENLPLWNSDIGVVNCKQDSDCDKLGFSNTASCMDGSCSCFINAAASGMNLVI